MPHASNPWAVMLLRKMVCCVPWAVPPGTSPSASKAPKPLEPGAPSDSLWRVFDGFDEFDIATTATTIHGRRGGDGPPVLLLHGIPETHIMWHRVAPALAEHFSVVVTDLRGFGDSSTPPSTPDHVSGHFLPEEAPDETARRLLEFLS